MARWFGKSSNWRARTGSSSRTHPFLCIGRAGGLGSGGSVNFPQIPAVSEGVAPFRAQRGKHYGAARSVRWRTHGFVPPPNIVSPATRTDARAIRPARLRGAAGGRTAASGGLVTRFIGRAEPMAQFIGAVTEDPRSAARIVGISGAPGAGKTRFVEEAIARLSHAGRPVTVVQPQIVSGLDGQGWLRAFSLKLPLGGAMLSGAIARFSQDAGARLDESSARALLNALFHETYDCGVERRGFVQPKFQRLALVIDNFDLLPSGIVTWLADIFLPRLDEVRTHLDYVLVLVGDRPLAAALEPVAWNAQPMRFLSIDLPPMSEAESVELLAAFARRSSEARSIHEIGEGLPGAMLELLRHRVLPMAEQAAALARCNEAQAGALLAVAGLGFATEEGLRLVLGPTGVADAQALLEPNIAVPVFGSLRSGGLWLPGAVARLVHEKLAPAHRAVVDRAAATAELLEELTPHFPTDTERATAARLALFRHFSRAALQAAFGSQEAEQLERFARTHGSAFQTTPADNLRLADGLQPLLLRYVEAQGDPAEPAWREKLARLWAERTGELQAELKTVDEGIARMESERDRLLKDLETARRQQAHHESEHRQEWRGRIDQDVVRVGASLLANGAGVACFWVALFTGAQRLTFLLLGAILIGIGIGTPALKRGHAPAADAGASFRRRHEERAAHAREMVAMIEARVAGVQQRLATERKKHDKLRAAADEPYL